MKRSVILLIVVISVLVVSGCVQQPTTSQKQSQGMNRVQAENIAKDKIVQIIGRGSNQNDFYSVNSYKQGSNYIVSLGSNKWDIDDCGDVQFTVFNDGGVRLDTNIECIS